MVSEALAAIHVVQAYNLQVGLSHIHTFTHSSHTVDSLYPVVSLGKQPFIYITPPPPYPLWRMQDRVCSLYRRMLDAAVPRERKACQVAGLSLAYSQAAIFIVVAIVVYFGGAEVSSGRATFENMLKAFMSIVFAAMGVAQAMVSFPDIGKAGPAVQRMMRLLYPDGSDVRAQYRSTAGGDCGDSQQAGATALVVAADDASEDSDVMHGRINELQGRVQLVRVWFSYPTRPDVRVLQDFSLDIAPRECHRHGAPVVR